MKRIILTGLCAAFSFGLFAQKSLIIHMKDGTKKEIPMVAVEGFAFNGKAIVNDGDYTDISTSALYSDTQLNITFTAGFHTDDPTITAIEGPVYGTDWGILYGTTPDVTIENGTIVQISDDQKNYVNNLADYSMDVVFGEAAGSFHDIVNRYPVDLDFETSYYFRTFVRRPATGNYEEGYFYSKELHINTGKPYMCYYGVTIDTAPYAESGYVIPSDDAWNALKERERHCVGGDIALLMKYWYQYLTLERIAQFKPQCTTVYECSDGKLYILDTIGDDFVEYLIDELDDEAMMTGYAVDWSLVRDETSQSYYKTARQSYMTCDAKWNVPNNEYWKYEPSLSNNNPVIYYMLPQPLLGNYTYKIEVTIAPNTEAVDEESIKPNRITATYYYTDADGKRKNIPLVKKHEIDTHEVSVLTFDSITAPVFGQAELEIRGDIGAREKGFDRTLRIARIRVIPVGSATE